MKLRLHLGDLLQRWRPGPTVASVAETSVEEQPPAPLAESADQDVIAQEPPPEPEPPPPAPPAPPAEIIEALPTLTFVAHVSGLGDRAADAQGWAGRPSGEGRIEGFWLSADAPLWTDGLTYHAVLPDRALGPLCRAGRYCGTRGKSAPLHGFVIQITGSAPGSAFTYEGIFADGFHSGALLPGQLCVSPTAASLVRMRVGFGVPPTPPKALPVNQLDRPPPSLSLLAHIQSRGDTAPAKDGWVGVPAGHLAIEAFTLSSNEPDWHSRVSYQPLLRDGTCAPPVPGGGLCGTRYHAIPMHGFVLNIADDAEHLRTLTYEGAFADGFRSPPLSPGTLCSSPTNARLVAMRVRFAASPDGDTGEIKPEATAKPPENVRMVVWDLDECFWGGTLTEGGITWNETHAGIVRVLAQRGIPSTICSKNDPAPVLAILEQHGMRDYFVFPSISWESKGPRLADLVTAVQLRAETMLFIDDNAMNRAEAHRFVPGLQVEAETFIPHLLAHPLLQGKPDPEMQRLAQYRVLERRHVDIASTRDATAFLRDSNIRVSIEYDLEPHLDRAIDLINRTNQLNFTKSRLPENLDDARMVLRDLLAQYDVQGAILRVRDNYGDYGYCGLYIVQGNAVMGRSLLHFAFSCRILGMGVESWMYRAIGRPKLDIKGEVVSDILGDSRDIDWIHTDLPDLDAPAVAGKRRFEYVFARGNCELYALSHYFTPFAGRIIDELVIVRGGQQTLLSHSLVALQAIRGIDHRAIESLAPCGFLPEDFDTFLLQDKPPGKAVWLLSFTIEAWVPYYRHRQTGALLPIIPARLEISSADMMRGETTLSTDPALVSYLRENFEFLDRVPAPLFQESLLAIFARAPQDAHIFVVLANTLTRGQDGTEKVIENMRRHNALITEAASQFSNIVLISPEPFMVLQDTFSSLNPQHFDRMVYYRIFQHIMKILADS
jgi:FkbH-like protein